MSQYKKADRLETIYVWDRIYSSQSGVLIIHYWVLKGKPCFKSPFSCTVVSIKQVTLQRKNSNCWVGSPEYWNQTFVLFISKFTWSPPSQNQMNNSTFANQPKWLAYPQWQITGWRSHLQPWTAGRVCTIRCQTRAIPLSHSGGNAPGQLGGTSGPLGPTATP